MKKFIIIFSIILFSISTYIVLEKGKELSFDKNIDDLENISITYNKDIINCNYEIKNNNIHFDIKGIKPGKTTITIEGISDNKTKTIEKNVYVHETGVITLNSFLGKCSGDISFVISFYIIVVLMIIHLIVKYIKNKKEKPYSYGNARRLGLLFFLTITCFFHLFFFIYDMVFGYGGESINFFLRKIRDDTYLFLAIVLPIVIIVTFLVSISNLRLLKKEGKKWTNMLGIILGHLICLSTVIIIIYGSSSENAIPSLTKNYIYNTIAIILTYLECILLGVSILALKAARKTPKFDKDAIIILGCKIKQDGTLTNLLKSRVDRAIEFSKMQKEKTGKDIIFIPSGGQGRDEIISEAKAMNNYLLEEGIKKENILIEDKATNTYENIKFSNKLIQNKIKKPKLAFSTTNYHVFRTGIIANKQNVNIEGIGAKTKAYYWINAFIREFIATLISEKKDHIKTIIELMIILLLFTIIIYF